MKSKDTIQLAVRLLGLVFLYHALRDLPSALALIFASFPHKLGGGVSTRGSFAGFVSGAFVALWPFLVSWWLLRGAPLIMRVSYPEPALRTKNDADLGAVPE